MSLRVSAVVILWIAALAVPHAQQTQVPRVMWYSGVFRPVTTQLIASVEQVTVAVYRDRDGGDVMWQETQNVAMEAGGRYNLLMGATSPDGLPADLFTSGEARWIGITFNRPGEVEQPRIPMASVPYALKAADADTLGGLPASAYLRADTSKSASTDGLSSQGSEAAASSDVSVLTAGTPGYVGLFTDSANLGNSVLFQSGNSVVLGGTVPRDMFHVSFTEGTGTLTGYGVQNLSGGANAFSGMLFYDQNNALGLFQGFNNVSHEYRINNIASGGSISFRIGGSAKFLVANSGNIGLGVPAPASKLDVSGDINLTGTLKMGGATVLRQSTTYDYVGVGYGALGNAPAIFGNTALGNFALGATTAGQYNTAVGAYALSAINGNNNTAVGYIALANVLTGVHNIGIGYVAGVNLGSDNSHNIMIANAGSNADNGVIRIGQIGFHTSFFVGGVRGVTTAQNNAVPVMIDSEGQLGTISSSRRFKEDIHDMGDASRGLLRLRPVTYRYIKPFGDGSKPIQYGLIAEEVAEVYPDLVARSADGRIETVKYQVLDAMLLNEVQRQQADMRALEIHIRTVIEQNGALIQQNAELQQRLAALEAAILGRK